MHFSSTPVLTGKLTSPTLSIRYWTTKIWAPRFWTQAFLHLLAITFLFVSSQTYASESSRYAVKHPSPSTNNFLIEYNALIIDENFDSLRFIDNGVEAQLLVSQHQIHTTLRNHSPLTNCENASVHKRCELENGKNKLLTWSKPVSVSVHSVGYLFLLAFCVLVMRGFRLS